MKFYTNTFYFNKPVKSIFTVNDNTDFIIGLKFFNSEGEMLMNVEDVTMSDGTSTLTAEDEKINGYICFAVDATNGESSKHFKVTATKGSITQDFDLVVYVRDADIGDVQLVTKEYVTKQIDDAKMDISYNAQTCTLKIWND